MPDIFLYPGEPNPQDIELRDPTVADSSGVALAASIVGVASAAADLAIQHRLAVTPVGVGAPTGALSVKHSLAAGPVGVGAATATLGVLHPVAGTGVGVGRSTAALSVTHTLGVVGAGIGRVAAALTVEHLLVVTLRGVTSARGALTEAVTTSGGAVPYLHPTRPRPHLRRLPGIPLTPLRPRTRPKVPAITTNDILALWASDALTDEEALAALT